MMNFKNLKNIKKKFKNNDLVLGGWLQISNPSIAELISCGPFDWIALDFEHGNFSFNDIPILIKIIHSHKKLALIRLGFNQRIFLEQSLECGVDGIIFSKIEDKIEMEELIKRSYYHPIGERGVGHSISNMFGINLKSQLDKFKPFICAIIESKKGAKNIQGILDCKNLDAVFIGPYDLNCSLGLNGDFNNKYYKKYLNFILESSNEKKIPCGIHIINGTKNNINETFKKGFNFIAYKTDALMLQESIKNI